MDHVHLYCNTTHIYSGSVRAKLRCCFDRGGGNGGVAVACDAMRYILLRHILLCGARRSARDVLPPYQYGSVKIHSPPPLNLPSLAVVTVSSAFASRTSRENHRNASPTEGG